MLEETSLDFLIGHLKKEEDPETTISKSLNPSALSGISITLELFGTFEFMEA